MLMYIKISPFALKAPYVLTDEETNVVKERDDITIPSFTNEMISIVNKKDVSKVILMGDTKDYINRFKLKLEKPDFKFSCKKNIEVEVDA